MLNNACNKTIYGDTPFHILYEYYPSFKDGVLCNATEEVGSDVTMLQAVVREKIMKKHCLWKERYDAAH